MRWMDIHEYVMNILWIIYHEYIMNILSKRNMNENGWTSLNIMDWGKKWQIERENVDETGWNTWKWIKNGNNWIKLDNMDDNT